MAVKKKQPPSARKLLIEAMRAASFNGAHFESENVEAWLPISEAQVNKFITERTLAWRQAKLIRPLHTAISLIDQGQI